MKRKTLKTKPARQFRLIKRVDFQRAGDAPSNPFEKEVQKKIGVMPGVFEVLIQDEENALYREAVENIYFSDLERKCLDLTREGLSPTEIARELGNRESSVRWYLRKAVHEIRKFIKQKYGLT